MSSGICFNLDQSNFFSSGNALKHQRKRRQNNQEMFVYKPGLLVVSKVCVEPENTDVDKSEEFVGTTGGFEVEDVRCEADGLKTGIFDLLFLVD